MQTSPKIPHLYRAFPVYQNSWLPLSLYLDTKYPLPRHIYDNRNALLCLAIISLYVDQFPIISYFWGVSVEKGNLYVPLEGPWGDGQMKIQLEKSPVIPQG
jgi:hypothetical protein